MVSLVRLRYVCSCTITAAKIKVRFGICYTFFPYFDSVETSTE
jgi:hypothetical protein